METKWFKIESVDEREKIAEAAQILRRGGLLAIPTETVYGLGANGLDEVAVRGIFEAKGRPQDNPLILHVPDASWLTRYCESVPESAYRLAERFWPGPLTIILPKKECVPYRTTGGLETVGVRCPDHAVTRAIIAEAGVPVAAPSANLSGRPSCTSAEHVREDMDGRIDGIVDGGECSVGVESSIIDLTVTPPRLLRPGGLSLEELREVLGEVAVDKAVTQKLSEGEKPRAPGMKYRHYAPKAPLTVVTGEARASARHILANAPKESGIICFEEFLPLFAGEVRSLGRSDDKGAQAQRVFAALRTFDETSVPCIFAQCPDSSGLGLAIGNRLKKAAGFAEIAVESNVKVIGITGCTGAGKTSLLTALKELGGEILDCDALYHQMLRDDEAMRRDIADTFGDVFDENGILDRKKLGSIVFADKEKLAQLDYITHVHLPRRAAQCIERSEKTLFGIDAIKLFESGLASLCDLTLAVTAAAETRVQRIMRRDGIGEEYARSRVAAQKDAAFYRERCDAEFVNNYPTVDEASTAAIEFLHNILKEEL
ncbi:MAG: threonylcarbamoyl-AMP synthase [Oscillospiraceae bacterium]|nr:threonylcarbamoyl-AMP synthase [Oscillospiraceae bacterium]